MNRFAKFSTLVMAGTTAVMMGTTSFASTNEFKQLQASVVSGLEALQVPTAAVPKLTMAQVEELSSILDQTTDSAASRAAAANQLIDQAVHPTQISLTNAGAKQMEAELKSDFEAAGLKWPGAEKLSLAQVQDLLVSFEKNAASGKDQAVQVLSQIESNGPATMHNGGAEQLATQLKGQLAQVGIELPASDKLSFQQVTDLSNIFASDSNTADAKAAAMKVLGM
jgi:hypothetical protein